MQGVTIRGAVQLLRSPSEWWRIPFAVLRFAHRDPARMPRAASRLDRLYRRRLRSSPGAVLPYLAWVQVKEGEVSTEALASQLAATTTDAATLVEFAKFYYLRDRHLPGDKLIARAKVLAPNLLRIYEEEAWNQRHRENIHREITAVERCRELVRADDTRLDWDIWLGQALLRRGDAAAAWSLLRQYSKLPVGDHRIFDAAACARRIGDPREQERALRLAAPDEQGGIDRVRAAEVYLTQHPSAADALDVLQHGTHPPATRVLELTAQAQLRLGNPEAAIETISAAAQRTDCAGWVAGTFGSLLELSGREGEALQAYASPRADRPIDRFRGSWLLAKHGDVREAVARLLASRPNGYPPLDHRLLDQEVDPALLGLLTRTAMQLPRAERIEVLQEVQTRAGSHDLRSAASVQLAALAAEDESWEAAWDHLVAAQDRRLPSVRLTRIDDAPAHFTREMRYSEFCATEPVRHGTVLYESSLGATTGCSPLAICLTLLQDPAHSHLLHVWSIAKDVAPHPALLQHDNVVFVAKGSPGYFRYLAIAQYLVNNSTFPTEFSKREGQRYLNTWHGVPWKTLGRDNRSEPAAFGNITRNFLHADAVLCNDPHTRDVLSRGMDLDELVPETFTLADAPRMDLTTRLSAERRNSIRRTLKASQEQGLVVYMPTWQGRFSERTAQVSEVLDTALGLAGPDTRVAVRAHHYVRQHFTQEAEAAGLVLVPDHIDTNELLGAADVVVTDFSSVLFDAAFAGVPVVKLTAGLDRYRADRGLYFTADDVPGESAATTAEARRLIERALRDPGAFAAAYAEQTARFGGPADGEASQRAIELLFGADPPEPPTPDQSRTLLISTDGFPPEIGITRSLRSLLTNLQGTGWSPYLRPWPSAVTHADEELRSELFTQARLLIGAGEPAGTAMERELLTHFSTRHYRSCPLFARILREERRREARRRYGALEFDGAIEFTGYLSSSISLISYGVATSGSRGVVFHNEMWPEITSKYPRLASGMQTLDGFDFIASVSDGVRDANAATLHEHFGVAVEKHRTIENTIDARRIRALAAQPLSAQDLSWYARPGGHACVVARMSPEKNHAALLQALAARRGSLTRPVLLSLLGDGPLRADLEVLAGQLGISDIVRFCGQVAAPQAHLSAADVLLLPSLHEGQPLVILEALTVGTPVIATDTPGSRSVLNQGALGTLVPISQAGLEEAIAQIAHGEFVDASAFDAEAFTRGSLQQLFDALDPS